MLEGKKIIVTGSASGMGEATLKAYVKAGANVVGMDISDQKGKDISLNANNIGPENAHLFILMYQIRIA